MAMVNAFILYKKVGGTKAQLKFRNVIALLLNSDDRINEDLPQISNKATFYHHKSSDLFCLSGQHYLAYIPLTASKKNAARKCIVCNHQGQHHSDYKLTCRTNWFDSP